MPADPTVGGGRSGPTVLIVTASMGAGHDAAATALKADLVARGARVVTLDWLALAGAVQGRALREGYRRMVTHAPAAYDVAMRSWARWPTFFERVTAAGAGSYLAGFMRELRRVEPDAVVSVYNLAGQAIGTLREGGELGVPLVVAVTDAGPHPYWRSRAADLHTAPLPETAAALRRYGAGRVDLAAPMISAPAPPAADPAAVAREFGIDPGAAAVLVAGGAWGVGAVLDAAAAVLAAGRIPVVLCGRSEPLQRRVTALPGAVAVPWTGRIGQLLGCCDAVVDSGGGALAWEALAARRPLVLHRPLAGHGRINARSLAAAGLATVSMDAAALTAALTAPAPDLVAVDRVFSRPSVAAAVMELLAGDTGTSAVGP